MYFIEIILSYLSIGLVVSFITTLVQHSQGVDKQSPIVAIASTLLWPVVIKYAILGHSNLD